MFWLACPGPVCTRVCTCPCCRRQMCCCSASPRPEPELQATNANHIILTDSSEMSLRTTHTFGWQEKKKCFLSLTDPEGGLRKPIAKCCISSLHQNTLSEVPSGHNTNNMAVKSWHVCFYSSEFVYLKCPIKVRCGKMNVSLVGIFVTHQNGMEIAVWPLLCVHPK